MASRALALSASLVTSNLVIACSDPGVCTTDILPAVAVEVRDASTDGFIAGLVRGVVTDGAFEDSLRVIGSLGTDPPVQTTLGGADERAARKGSISRRRRTRRGTRPGYGSLGMTATCALRPLRPD
jgi:hypothetical protein